MFSKVVYSDDKFNFILLPVVALKVMLLINYGPTQMLFNFDLFVFFQYIIEK